MWWFNIKVLGTQDGSVKGQELIRAVGDEPEQYPVYEEDNCA